jgi:hypothetical protein
VWSGAGWAAAWPRAPIHHESRRRVRSAPPPLCGQGSCRFTAVFRSRTVSKLVGPHALGARALSEEGLAQVTLSRWFGKPLDSRPRYCPEYPSAGFASLDQARACVARFVTWYNTEHQHSGIGYVAPADRHAGNDVAILSSRTALYRRAQRRNPERWSGSPRSWSRPLTVTLSPEVERRSQTAAVEFHATSISIPSDRTSDAHVAGSPAAAQNAYAP